jgi:hypothetical protein
MQGVNGETFQVAPTNAQTGLSQPAPTAVVQAPPTTPNTVTQ